MSWNVDQLYVCDDVITASVTKEQAQPSILIVAASQHWASKSAAISLESGCIPPT
jgi:hypothetical protein